MEKSKAPYFFGIIAIFAGLLSLTISSQIDDIQGDEISCSDYKQMYPYLKILIMMGSLLLMIGLISILFRYLDCFEGLQVYTYYILILLIGIFLTVNGAMIYGQKDCRNSKYLSMILWIAGASLFALSLVGITINYRYTNKTTSTTTTGNDPIRILV